MKHEKNVGKTKVFHVAGFEACPWHQRALEAVRKVQANGFAKLVDHTFKTRDAYREWLFSADGRQRFKNPRARKHTSSPFVWIGNNVFIGGHDDTIAYIDSEALKTTEAQGQVGCDLEGSALLVQDHYLPKIGKSKL